MTVPLAVLYEVAVGATTYEVDPPLTVVPETRVMVAPLGVVSVYSVRVEVPPLVVLSVT